MFLTQRHRDGVGGSGGGLPDPSLRGLCRLSRVDKKLRLVSPASTKSVVAGESLSYGGEPLRSSRATPAFAAYNGAEGTPPPTNPTILHFYTAKLYGDQGTGRPTIRANPCKSVAKTLCHIRENPCKSVVKTHQED